MSSERSQNPITLEEIVSNAKEIMLRDGNHVPVLIMEADDKLLAGQIPEMPTTHGERVQLMSFLGQTAAKSGRVDQLNQVFMVHEGWLSMASEEKAAEQIPSQDPNRKEVLIISAIEIREQKKHIRVFNILRDKDKQVIGFEEFLSDEKQKDTSIETPLLDAFFQGFQSTFRSKFS